MPRLLIALALGFFTATASHLAAGAAPTVGSPQYAPHPDYPASARARRAYGAGVFVMRVRIATGRVKEVIVARSTGHRDLDAAAVAALKKWRFMPGALPAIEKLFPKFRDPLAAEEAFVKQPVTFGLQRG